MVSLRNRVEQGLEDFAHFDYRNDTLKLTFLANTLVPPVMTVPSSDFRQNMTIRIPSN